MAHLEGDRQRPIYEALTEPFGHTYTDPRGFTYITGEQVISRLNTVLGPFGWAFEVKEHRYDDDADEVLVLGRLTVRDPDTGTTIVREQFGSQKHNRRRGKTDKTTGEMSEGEILDDGYDHKGAATDALKKCASLLGVGLYLYEKKANGAAAAPARQAPQARPSAAAGDVPVCAECGSTLKETRFKDGTVWGPEQLAGYSQRKHGQTLCMDHYRAANEARAMAARGGG